jgi:hypothetical protein
MKETCKELAAALGNLLHHTYQMSGMFSDDDGTIAKATEDAEAALELYRETAIG